MFILEVLESGNQLLLIASTSSLRVHVTHGKELQRLGSLALVSVAAEAV